MLLPSRTAQHGPDSLLSDRLRDWDRHVVHLSGHVYQSRAWAVFQAAQGRPVLSAAGATWSWLAAVRRGRGGLTYLYAAYGPTVQAGGLPPAVASLVRAGRDVHADFIRFEPLGAVQDAALHELGGRPVRDMQPRYRLVLDISAAETHLHRNISSSNRNLINTAAKRGLSFQVTSDPAMIAEYLAMQRQTTARNKFKTQPDAYYQQLAQALLPIGAARLYFAVHDSKPVASAIGMDFGGTRYYVYAASYPDLNRQLKAAVALLWWMIVDARAQGLLTFDYGGVAPDDQPHHPWAGPTRFKKSIGGELVASVGTWEIPLKPVKYRAYHCARTILRV